MPVGQGCYFGISDSSASERQISFAVCSFRQILLLAHLQGLRSGKEAALRTSGGVKWRTDPPGTNKHLRTNLAVSQGFRAASLPHGR